MKLLHIIGTLDPTYGGPVEALRQLSKAITGLGHEVEVVTLDSPTDPWISQFPVIVHPLGPSKGKYRYNKYLIKWLKNNARRFDKITVNGIWQYQSFATWLASRNNLFKYSVFVHGALDPWFKQTYPFKHLKKWLYWPWTEYRVLRDAEAVLFTSEEEKRLASKSFWLYKANEVVVNYGIGTPILNPVKQKNIFFNEFPELRDKRLILFMSRIHQKKGCDLLIEAFSRIANVDPKLHLLFAGPDQSGLTPVLRNLASNLKIDQRITWTGMISNDLKWGAFQAAEVFALPSHSENFGVAAVEALACGLPVLISNKVNIWREIKEDGAGLVSLDNIDGVNQILKTWLSLNPSEKQAMSFNAIECFNKRFEIKFVAESFVKMS